ncbi:hypothetical protein [Caldisericum sp.]|uniref:hypothetical protein n=1 Tax=Caldisericum sp. TaxID=2499687 RepID=UPI003D1159C4
MYALQEKNYQNTNHTNFKYDRKGISDLKSYYKEKIGVSLDFIIESAFIDPIFPPTKIKTIEDGSKFYFFREDTIKSKEVETKLIDYFVDIISSFVIGELKTILEETKENNISSEKKSSSLDKESFIEEIKTLFEKSKVKEAVKEKDLAFIVLLFFEKLASFREFRSLLKSYHEKYDSLPENFIRYVIQKTIKTAIFLYRINSSKSETEQTYQKIFVKIARSFWHFIFDHISFITKRHREKNLFTYLSYTRAPHVKEYFDFFENKKLTNDPVFSVHHVIPNVPCSLSTTHETSEDILWKDSLNF